MNRIEQLQLALGEAGADAVVLRLAENVVLTTGYWPQIGGLGIVVVPREGEASLLVPEYEEPEVRTRWQGDVRLFPAIRFREHLIWGLTLRVLTLFSDALDHPLPHVEAI